MVYVHYKLAPTLSPILTVTNRCRSSLIYRQSCSSLPLLLLHLCIYTFIQPHACKRFSAPSHGRGQVSLILQLEPATYRSSSQPHTATSCECGPQACSANRANDIRTSCRQRATIIASCAYSRPAVKQAPIFR